MKRAAKAIAEALADSESCPVLLENTAGTQGPLGRDFDELARAGRAARRRRARRHLPRLAATCSPRGSRSARPRRSTTVVDEFDAKVGLERLALPAPERLEDPARRQPRPPRQPRRGRDRRARARASSSPSRASTQLPTLIETGGDDGAPGRADVELARKLRKRGIAARQTAGGGEALTPSALRPVRRRSSPGSRETARCSAEAEPGDRERNRRHRDHVEAGERQRADVAPEPSPSCRSSRGRRVPPAGRS